MLTDLGEWDGRAVARLNDESLDAAIAPNLTPELTRRLADGPLVLDVTAVRFADSIGLGLLAQAHRRWPGRLALTGVGPALRKCLGRVAAGLLPPEVENVIPSDRPSLSDAQAILRFSDPSVA